MSKFRRHHIARRNDDTLSNTGHSPELDRKARRKPDTTVGRRLAGDDAEMHGDAGPCEALHERHWGAGIDV